MAQTDPEDGFDQIMVQSWNSVAQQLRTLHNELSGDRARRRERAERAVQNERYEQTRRQQQSIRLEQWEMDNRERLNKGFESTLNATVLADGDGWRKMRDSSLLQGWMVADQLEGNDPGYRRQIIEAKARLKDEWSKRHPETHIDAAADQLTNHVNITYTDQSPALQATLNAFNTAGVPVDLQRVEDTQAFQAAHGDDATFFVDSRLTGQWTGYDHDRIVEAVMCAPVNGVDDAASRISFLKDQGLPHSAEAGMAKWWGPKLAYDVIHQCLLCFGHGGYDRGPMEQRLRDVLGFQIGDGTAQIMKTIIARARAGRKFVPA